MEYFAGSLLTMITMYLVARLVKSPKNNIRSVKTRFSQSRQYSLVSDFIPTKTKQLNTQASKHNRSQYSRIIFVNNTAYWIEYGSVHSADFDGQNIDFENKIKVDMMAMDDVELDKMIFIVERLTEGLSNDSGNSGN